MDWGPFQWLQGIPLAYYHDRDTDGPPLVNSNENILLIVGIVYLCCLWKKPWVSTYIGVIGMACTLFVRVFGSPDGAPETWWKWLGSFFAAAAVGALFSLRKGADGMR